jgi:hypothetical protein
MRLMQSRLVIMPVHFEVNGNNVSVEVEPRMTLADCLRHDPQSEIWVGVEWPATEVAE